MDFEESELCLQKLEIKSETADCDVCNKPAAEKCASQDTGKQPCSNHDGQLEV